MSDESLGADEDDVSKEMQVFLGLEPRGSEKRGSVRPLLDDEDEEGSILMDEIHPQGRSLSNPPQKKVENKKGKKFKSKLILLFV